MNIFNAANELVNNRVNSREARVNGLKIMLAQAYGGDASILFPAVNGRSVAAEDFVDTHGLACFYGEIGSSEPDEAGLPSVRPQFLNVVARLARTRTEDAVVRSVARCMDERLGPVAEARLTPADVELHPVCDFTYSLRTASPHRVSLDWSVVGTAEKGGVTIDSGRTVKFFVTKAGSVVISYKGKTLASASANSARCRYDPH